MGVTFTRDTPLTSDFVFPLFPLYPLGLLLLLLLLLCAQLGVGVCVRLLAAIHGLSPAWDAATHPPVTHTCPHEVANPIWCPQAANSRGGAYGRAWSVDPVLDFLCGGRCYFPLLLSLLLWVFFWFFFHFFLCVVVCSICFTFGFYFQIFFSPNFWLSFCTFLYSFFLQYTMNICLI